MTGSPHIMSVMGLSVEQLRRSRVELSVLHRSGNPVILFLHGLAGYGGEWLGVVSHLSESVGVLIPDQRGHGASRGGSGFGVSRDDLVDDAVELIEGMADGSPVVVVGQSMGGIVSTYLASKRPDLVAALILIETGMEAMTDAQFNALTNWLDSWSSGFGSCADALAFFGTDAPSSQGWVDGLEWNGGRLAGRFDPTQMVGIMRNLASGPRWAEWANIKADTTLVTASSSVLDDADIERMLEIAPHAECVRISDSGHNAHLDQPEVVAAVITETVHRVRSRRT